MTTWRTNPDGSLICPHRSLSVCDACALHPEVTAVAGVHYYDATGDIAAGIAEPERGGEAVPR